MGQGYSEDEAITLMSVAADFGITQVPDRVNQCQPRHASVSSSLSPRFGLVPSLCPAVAHMSSSQVVDGNWGAHVVIPKKALKEVIYASPYQCSGGVRLQVCVARA
jgi:acetamidase/formamidase